MVFFSNCLLGKWKSFHNESFDFGLKCFGGKLVMSGLHCESFIFSWVLIIMSLFKTNLFVCPWLKEMLLVKMEKPIEKWDKSSMCVVHVYALVPKGRLAQGTIVCFHQLRGLVSGCIAMIVSGPYARYVTSGMFWC